MREAETSQNMSPGILRVVESAQRNPLRPMYSLGHHLDQEALRRAYARLRGNAAVGVDGVTKDGYGANLEANIADLHQRMQTQCYRHQPIRRVNIPKDNGDLRPLGVSTTADKLVQGVLSELLSGIYEPVFLEGSYGFRPGRSAHDAMRAVDRGVGSGAIQYVIEADIVGFFDNLDRAKLREMIQQRVADKSVMRLIGKCLAAGVLDGEQYTEPTAGTPQGSILSPVLGNIYLHYALDAWFEQMVKPVLRGRATLIRYADDFILGFERGDDATRVMKVLPARMAKFGLKLHAEKTRMFDFRRPPSSQVGGKGPSTFDFLGFTIYWRRNGRGRWHTAYKTRRARLIRAIQRIHEWCRDHRHDPVEAQYKALIQRLVGHLNYFAVNDNQRCISRILNEAECSWRFWLNRRSQRARMTWKKFVGVILAQYPMPHAKVRVTLWAR